jgi:glycosyltransferase involved in cell wall biosynthesis
MNRPTPRICLVVPCYNEQEVLPLAAARLAAELESLRREALVAEGSSVLFVDDGSSDDTWRIISGLADSGAPFSGVRLTRNFGHQYALYAGLMLAPGDALVSLDADLQDDIGALRDMLRAFAAGKEIVYGVRSDRSSDTRFKRMSAALHYRIAAWLGVEAVPNHADFRLMSRRAVELLGQYRESNLYLRGIVPLLGLDTGTVEFRRDARAGGRSKYGLRRMLSLSLRGLTSFSIMPLRLIAVMGLVVFFISLVLGGWALAAALWNERAVPGWASTVIPIYVLGGLQLLAIGVAGEYIGKTYMEVKHRPLFLVQETRGLTDAPSSATGEPRG